MSTVKNVTVAGSGVLGSQIAFQCAMHGFNVSVYDINQDAINKAKTSTFPRIVESIKVDLKKSPEDLKLAQDRLAFFTDLKSAVADADLIIEAVPENLNIKIDFYESLSKVAPEKTIFATNSSTLLPSQIQKHTGRPEKFLALHFANQIWKNNTAEIMGHPKTSPQIFDTVVGFSQDIGMVALPLHKEQPGYILNSLLVPFLDAATNLLANDIADFKSIDKTWMIATGAPHGPFAILDIVGITTAYNINKMAAEKSNDPRHKKVVDLLKRDFIDKGKLGVATGEGFYKYPNPEYLDKNFLKESNQDSYLRS